MKKIMLIICLLTFLSCGGNSDDILTQPEIETKMKLVFDSFHYQERYICDRGNVKLPWKFINGNESLWVDDNYIIPSTGYYNVSIKYDAIYYGAFDYGGSNITKRCDLVAQYGIGVGIWFSSEDRRGNFGVIKSTECDKIKSFNKTETYSYQKGFVLTLEASLISKTYESLGGRCENINFIISNCEVIIEKI
jgi:hypothetical protein